MGKKKPSQFELWFVAQFGERKQAFQKYTDHQLLQMMMTGEDAAQELRCRQIWDAQYTAASYARNAATTNFTF